MIRGARDADVVAASLKRSVIWSVVQSKSLTINERIMHAFWMEAGQPDQYHEWRDAHLNLLHDDSRAARHARFLQDLGDGTLAQVANAPLDTVAVPDYLESNLPPDPSAHDAMISAVEHVFADLNTARGDIENATWHRDRAILCPLNTEVREVNNDVLSRLHPPGPGDIRLSADSCSADTDETLFPMEFLNTVEPGGFPPHRLHLKVGAPYMVLRNLKPAAAGLANGIRVLLLQICPSLLRVKILTGTKAGTTAVICRINLEYGSNDGLPFSLTRRQFPVAVSSIVPSF